MLLLMTNAALLCSLFLSIPSPVSAFLLFLLNVMKPESEWRKFIRNVASPAVLSWESLRLSFPPLGHLWMTIAALGAPACLAAPAQSAAMQHGVSHPQWGFVPAPAGWGLQPRAQHWYLLPPRAHKANVGLPDLMCHQGSLLVSLYSAWLGISCSNLPTELKQHQKNSLFNTLFHTLETRATTPALPPLTVVQFPSVFSTPNEI